MAASRTASSAAWRVRGINSTIWRSLQPRAEQQLHHDIRSLLSRHPISTVARPQSALASSTALRPFTSHWTPSVTPLRASIQSVRHASGPTQPSHSFLAHLEQTANNNPASASSQSAFYNALLRANMPEILVERYETGRYATNAVCDSMYYRALERMGQSSASPAPTSPNAPTPVGSSRGATQEQLLATAKAVGANVKGYPYGLARAARPGQAETGDKNSPFYVVVDESKSSYFWKITRFFLLWGFFGYIALSVIAFAIDASGTFRRPGGSQNAEVKPEHQKARFSDVQGCDEAKEELQEIVDFLKSPEKYNQLGGKLPKGVLMVGPPGTGKTLLARAVAGEAGVPFFYMSGSEFDEVYVGVGAKRVRELFTQAKAKAPAIIFIDELDAVGGKRNDRDAAYHMQTLNQMLTELDGFDQTTGVVFMGATNFPQMLDKALTRPGRLDREIVVELPDVRGRINILKHYMKNKQIATDVDASAIARGTPGFSGADLENLVNSAAVQASKSSNKKISMLDFEWAKDRLMMGAEKKSMVILEKDKLMTAYHEAGHALVAMYTPGADPLYKATIMPRGMALGVTYSLPEMDKVSRSRQELFAVIDRAMGGKLAEEIVYGEDMVSTGCSSDLSSATETAYAMVVNYGMSSKLGSIAFDGKLYQTLSNETKQRIEDEVRRFLDEGMGRARTLLTTRRNELDLLAHALVKYETLSKDEMEKVVRGESLPDRKPTADPNAPIKVPVMPEPSPVGGGGGGPGQPPPEEGPPRPAPVIPGPANTRSR